MNTNQIPDSASNNPSKYLKYFIYMCVILTFILLGNLFLIITTYQQNQISEERATNYEIRVEEARKLVQAQQEIVFDLMSAYESDAYANPSVERIAEQQLIASEYSLQALQILAIQNSQVVELLASMP